MPSFTIIGSNAVPARIEAPTMAWFHAAMPPWASRPTSTRCTHIGR